MADRAEHIAAFDEIAARLRDAAAANARALAVHHGDAAGPDVERQLEHTLDRLSLLYARGTLDGRAVGALIESAIAAELRLAHDLGAAGGAEAEARAHALLGVARRGHRLHVRGVVRGPLLRGVYVARPRRAFELDLQADRMPFVRWRGGILVVLAEQDLAALRVLGDEVEVVFLDPDELLALCRGDDRAAIDAELERRVARADTAPDRVGDDRARYLRRMLLIQSTLLRHLRDRLATEHPVAHRALAPVLADHRAALTQALVAVPDAADPLTASIDHERALQALVTRWAAEPDVAGLGDRIRAVAGAGTHLAALERHRGHQRPTR